MLTHEIPNFYNSLEKEKSSQNFKSHNNISIYFLKCNLPFSYYTALDIFPVNWTHRTNNFKKLLRISYYTITCLVLLNSVLFSLLAYYFYRPL